MALFRRLLERRTHPSQHSLAGIWGLNSTTYAGPVVTEDTAMTYSAVFAAVRLLSWSIAMLPLLTYRRRPGQGRDRAVEHPLYNVLKEEANPEMTAFNFRSLVNSHAIARGNGFAEIEWSRSGTVMALWPLNPTRMDVQRIQGELRYLYDLPDGTTANLPAWRVHHVRGLGGNGVIGYSVIRMAMQAIGLGLGTEEYGARFFGNGARPGVILRHPGKLSDTAFGRLQKSWNADHQGLTNAHRAKILEEGMDVETIGVPPEEAQFLETRKFQISEIARWFNVPPHMLADLERATFGNIEEQGLGFVTYSLGPWLVNIEQQLALDLLTREEKKTLYVEHLVDGLLRGRIMDRFSAYNSAIQAGWMNRNEARERENMNPFSDGEAFLVPMNMTPAGSQPSPAGQRSHRAAVSQETETATPAEQRAQDLGDQRRKIMAAYVDIYQDVAARMVRREVKDLREALASHTKKRTIQDFLRWLEGFYQQYRAVLIDAFHPAMVSLAKQMAGVVAAELEQEDAGVTERQREFIDSYLSNFADYATIGSQRQLEAIVREALAENADPAPLLEERLDGWAESKADKIAKQQAYEAGNALIVSLYGAAGVAYLRWVARGDSCPHCRGLNGKVVGINGYFINAGDSVEGGEGDEPMLVRRNTRHAPIHGGCDCTVVAEKR